MTGKVPCKLTDEHHKAFKLMKAILASDALLTYPNLKLPYHVETELLITRLAVLLNKMPSCLLLMKIEQSRRTTQQLKMNYYLLLKHSMNSTGFISGQ